MYQRKNQTEGGGEDGKELIGAVSVIVGVKDKKESNFKEQRLRKVYGL